MPVIIYNGKTLPNIYGKFRFSESYKTANLSCTFLVQENSAAALVGECTTIEGKLREKNKNLTLNFGGTAEYSFAHATNTGFLSRPTLNKLENELCTETSRAYSFSIEIQLPFTQAGYNYRQDGSFSVNYMGTRRKTVSLNCTYTAGGTETALENYNLYAKTWAGVILTLITGNFELISENVNPEQENKRLTATLVYREILAEESDGVQDEDAIVNANCSYSVTYAQEVGVFQYPLGLDVLPPVKVNISYNAEIDKEQVALDTGIEEVYRTKVKPWIIKHAYAVLGLGSYTQAGQQYIVQQEGYSINPYNYTISGNITFLAPKSFEQVLEARENINISKNYNLTKQKIWDGKDYTYNMYSIGAEKTLNRTVNISKLGNSVKDIQPISLTYPKWHKISEGMNIQMKRFGVGTTGVSLNKVDVYIQSFTEQYIWVEALIGGV